MPVGFGIKDALGGAPVHVRGELLEKRALLAFVLHAFDGSRGRVGAPLHPVACGLDALPARLLRLAFIRTNEEGPAAVGLPFELLHGPTLGLEAPLQLADARLGLRAEPLGVVLGRLLKPARLPNEDRPRVEMITGVAGRHYWPAHEKLRIVEESLTAGVSISAVVRRNGVAPNLLFRWRHLMAEGGAMRLCCANRLTAEFPFFPSDVSRRAG